jgi:hypothetical protein
MCAVGKNKSTHFLFLKNGFEAELQSHSQQNKKTFSPSS